MEIEIGIRLRVDVRHEPMREPLACRAVSPAREHPVQVLPILRHDVDAALMEALDVQNRQDDKRSLDLFRPSLHQADGRLDGAELGTMNACSDEQTRTDRKSVV